MKKILLGITGSIAAYKSAALVRLLKKAHYDVRIVMTRSATEIITPMTLQVLSQHPVRVALFNQEDEADIDHIALARWADRIIIAPATANIIAKLTYGLADDLLSTLCLAAGVPIVIAPAMNHAMWKNPATQANIYQLKSRQVQFITPDAGEQACGEFGEGRMQEPEAIIAWLQKQQQHEQALNDKHILITAGPTIERIDPVRFLSNDSSGKMGYAIAEAARQLGAKVTLVSGKTYLCHPDDVTFIAVTSAQKMHQAVFAHIDKADWFIACAAVADYRIDAVSKQKIKKDQNKKLTLTLMPNPDILAAVCQQKVSPFTIGFAAETENIIAYGKAKRLKKGADLIAVNDVSDTSIGFNSDNNRLTLIGDNFTREFPVMAKSTLAKAILLAALDYQQQSGT